MGILGGDFSENRPLKKKDLHRIILSLGANIGDRKSHIDKALSLIESRCGEILKKSAFYESKALGFNSDNRFLNICVEIESSLTPQDILNSSRNIEKDLGRERKSENYNYSDRQIDIDIIYFDNEVISGKDLQIPHPRMHERLIVLEPLNEIAPKFIHPLLKKTSAELLKDCPDVSKLSVYLGQ